MELSKKIEEVAKSTEIQDVSIEVAETMIDLVLDEGVIKDIPIIGSIVGVARGVFTIKDRIFAKKILYFLNELKDVTEVERLEQIERINNSKEYQIKVGDKLIYAIDKSSDTIASSLIGKIFSLFLGGLIAYDHFLDITRILNSTELNRVKQECALNLIGNLNKGCLNAPDLVEFFQELSLITNKQIAVLKWVELNKTNILEKRILEKFTYRIGEDPELETSNAYILLKNAIYQLGAKEIFDRLIGLDNYPLFPEDIEITDYGTKIIECMGIVKISGIETNLINELIFDFKY